MKRLNSLLFFQGFDWVTCNSKASGRLALSDWDEQASSLPQPGERSRHLWASWALWPSISIVKWPKKGCYSGLLLQSFQEVRSMSIHSDNSSRVSLFGGEISMAVHAHPRISKNTTSLLPSTNVPSLLDTGIPHAIPTLRSWTLGLCQTWVPSNKCFIHMLNAANPFLP